jgi:hypothetical protein
LKEAFIMRLFLPLAIACFAVLVCGSSVRADSVDNPRYQAWAKFGVGSSETLQASISTGGMQMTAETQFQLAEKADDQVTINITTTVMGHQSAPRPQVISSKMDGKEINQLPNEKVDAAGKTFDCKVFEVPDPNAQAQGTTMKVWVSDDVPGGCVKMEAVSPRSNTKVTYLLESYDAK